MKALVSIVVPVFNEAQNLVRDLGRLSEYLDSRTRDRYELIVVDDGSTDATPVLLKKLELSLPHLTTCFHERNRGIHEALRTGIARTHGERIVTFDSDLTYAPQTIDELLEVLEGNFAHIAVASPYARSGRCIGVPWIRRILSQGANRYLSLAVRGQLRTLTCMVRAYNGPFLRRLNEQHSALGFTYDILLQARREGAVIVEVPAILDWSAQPRGRGRRIRLGRILQMTWDVAVAGLRERPALLAAIPGIAPGLLPFVIFAAILLRQPLKTVALIAAITVVIQYSSLLIFSLQLGDCALVRWRGPKHAR